MEMDDRHYYYPHDQSQYPPTAPPPGAFIAHGIYYSICGNIREASAGSDSMAAVVRYSITTKDMKRKWNPE